jgi:hypothetical protein
MLAVIESTRRFRLPPPAFRFPSLTPSPIPASFRDRAA